MKPIVILVTASLCFGAAFFTHTLADLHPLSIAFALVEPVSILGFCALVALSAGWRHLKAATVATIALTAYTLGAGIGTLTNVDSTMVRPNSSVVSIPSFQMPPVDPACRHMLSGSGLSSKRKPIRVAIWNARGIATPSSPQLVTRDLASEITILNEVHGAETAQALAKALHGESLYETGYQDWGTALLVRNGSWQSCFQGKKAVRIPLPAFKGRSAVAVLGIARLPNDVHVSVVGLHNDRPATREEFLSWPVLLQASLHRINKVLESVPQQHVVVGGDTNTARSFRYFLNRFSGRKLARIKAHATWPFSWAGLNLWPIYALDRVWLSPDFEVLGSGAFLPPLPSDHRPVYVTLYSAQNP